MNEEKQNQAYFQETFREVHAPQELVKSSNTESATESVSGGIAASPTPTPQL